MPRAVWVALRLVMTKIGPAASSVPTGRNSICVTARRRNHALMRPVAPGYGLIGFHHAVGGVEMLYGRHQQVAVVLHPPTPVTVISGDSGVGRPVS
jgi:hypothetical protein